MDGRAASQRNLVVGYLNEAYKGSEEEQAFIRAHLQALRRLTPTEMFTRPYVRSLTRGSVADLLRLSALTSKCLARLAQLFGVYVRAIPPSRYYIGSPASDDMGGFHSAAAVGYEHFRGVGYSVRLNARLAGRDLIVLDVLRSYLHDSLHAATYKTFALRRFRPQQPGGVAKSTFPRVYREQYGINFRNADGLSYSDPALTALSPATINLNVLMDGVIVVVVTLMIREIMERSTIVHAHEPERAIYADLVGDWQGATYGAAQAFIEGVVTPAARFIDHWGGDALVHRLLRAMLTGHIAPLRKYFATSTGDPDAWESMFKRPTFWL